MRAQQQLRSFGQRVPNRSRWPNTLDETAIQVFV
jgi:hypothetical protein